MFETSKDILFIAIAFCVVIFTFFFCWAFYYIVMMLKKAHSAIKEISDLIVSIKEKINRLEKLFNTVEEKIKNSASYLPLVLKGVTELTNYLKKKKERRQEEKSKKKKS